MNKQNMAEGPISQVDKTYSQLKTAQKEKIGNWMYEAYKKQAEEKLSDDEALQYVFGKIEAEQILIPYTEIEKKYSEKKKQYRDRFAAENIPKHLNEMEEILDRAIQRMDALEKKMAEYEEFQTEIQVLEKYYTSQQWKDDFAMDEKGKLPERLKRGILSEDGIYNMLERNKELLERIKEKH